MRNYDYVLALDPSGNYTEGKGTTGWSLFSCVEKRIVRMGDISAKRAECMEGYWYEHIKLIDFIMNKYPNTALVIEDYLLYAAEAKSQINSRMETPKLIGVLQLHAWNYHIPCYMQPASEVKRRWDNRILIHKGYIKQNGKKFFVPGKPHEINRHCIDSIRHGVHFATFKNERKGKDE